LGVLREAPRLMERWWAIFVALAALSALFAFLEED
jgi:hypothetical protein